MGAPLLGYVPEAGQIVPVNGIAAAASAGPALDFGGTFLQMAISPRHDFMLASAASGTVLIAYPSGMTAAGTTAAVAGTSTFPSSITLSPTGAAAVLWFASSQTIQIVSGLPAAPVVRTVNAGFLSGASGAGAGASGDAPSTFAVSDDGAWAAGAWPSGVWAFGPNGEVRSVFSSDRVFAMTFFTGLENLAVATGSGVYSIADVGGSASVSTVFAAPALTPTGLAVSSDNSTLVLSDRHGSIYHVNVAASTGSSVDCGCTPEGVFPMGGSVYRITGVTGSVFRVFDARSSIVFQIPLATGAQGKPAMPIPHQQPGEIGRSEPNSGSETLPGGPR